jgi:amino acid permease
MATLSFGDRKRLRHQGRISLHSSSLKEWLNEDGRDDHGELLPRTNTTGDHKKKSSFYQSTFNAINVLVGVGILSLPFAFNLAGWVPAFVLLLFFMCLTNYTARIIVKCLEYDARQVEQDGFEKDREKTRSLTRSSSETVIDELFDEPSESWRLEASGSTQNVSKYGTLSEETLAYTKNEEEEPLAHMIKEEKRSKLNTYADIGFAAFGKKGSIFISIVFTLELFAASIALIILIADSLEALLPSNSSVFYKFIAFCVVTPSLWLKHLHWLSYGSIIGILTIINLLVVVIYDGLSKEQGPGSLIDPAPTHAFPSEWARFPTSFGLIFAGFAGHAVFPSLYREMDEPKKFGKLLNVSYISTFIIYSLMASAGFLMFGEMTMQEITQNLAKVPEYNRIINSLTIWLIVINPITKFALTLQPVAVNMELFLLSLSSHPEPESLTDDDMNLIPFGRVRIRYGFFRILSRTILSALVAFIAIVYPGFERVIGLLGSLFSVMVSAIFPLSCYIKLFDTTIQRKEKICIWIILIICSVMALVGTIWSFLPEKVATIDTLRN